MREIDFSKVKTIKQIVLILTELKMSVNVESESYEKLKHLCKDES
jgi:hypothetical protein